MFISKFLFCHPVYEYMHTCGIESKTLRNFDNNAEQYVRNVLFSTNIDS